MKKFILLLLGFLPALSFAAAFNPDSACLPLDGVASALTVIGAATGAKDFQSSKIIYKGDAKHVGTSLDKKVKFYVQPYAFEMRYKGTHGDVLLITSGECEYSSDHKDTDPGTEYLLMIKPTGYMMKFHSEFEPPAYSKDDAKLWKQFKINEYQSKMNAPN
jgi:hypothetical protein